MTDVTRAGTTGGSADVVGAVDEQLIRELTERARSEGLQLTDEGGLLGRLTKLVAEAALEGEMDDHLGYSKHDPAGRNGENSRNGTRAKTVLTEAGPVEIAVPRDRDSSFEPKIVAKRLRRLTGMGDLVGLVVGQGPDPRRDLRAPGRDLWAEVSKQTYTVSAGGTSGFDVLTRMQLRCTN